MKVNDLADRHCPKKSWGYEEWIVNNDLYCGKRLHFVKAGGATSLHYHAVKHETMYVEEGGFLIIVVDTETAVQTSVVLAKGQSLEIKPNTPHRIKATTDNSVLIEFSTHHQDSDSYRIVR